MVGRNLLEHPDSADYAILAPARNELDLLNGQAVAHYLETHRPDAVIHCAGVVGGIQANIANPVTFFASNMQMALNVINGARNADVKQLLNLGSSCMYPRQAVNPLQEDALLTGELEPTNEGYALAKIGAARLCDYIVREDPAFKYKTIIPCNLYGRYDKFGTQKSPLYEPMQMWWISGVTAKRGVNSCMPVTLRISSSLRLVDSSRCPLCLM